MSRKKDDPKRQDSASLKAAGNRKDSKPEELVISDENLQHVLSAAGDLTYVWDLESDSISWMSSNPAAHDAISDIQNISSGDEYRQRLTDQDTRARDQNINHNLSHQTGPFSCDYSLLSASGENYWVNERSTILVEDTGIPKKIIGSLRLMNDSSEAIEKLNKSANHDALTGLFNENRLRANLDQALKAASQNKKAGAYLILSIDRMSLINDVHGSNATEQVIITTAHFLNEFIGSSETPGTVGRVSTDSFGIILPNIDEDALEELLGTLIDTICQKKFKLESNAPSSEAEPVQITASIGCVVFPEFTRTSQDAMIRAETALNNAKDSGRNCYRYFSFAKNKLQVQHRTMEIAERVRAALDANQVCFAFQPVVCAQTLEIKYYECLARLDQGEAPIMEAHEFITIAEQLGLTRQIDSLVLKNALEILDRYKELQLAINISGFNAGDSAWLQQLMASVYNRSDLANRLIIEITETAALLDAEETRRFVKIVGGLNCRVALDDFGEGHTSFRQLKTLPVNMVKIDGSFVQDSTVNTGNQLFIQTLLELAEGYNMTIIAECVENLETFKMLRTFGVHLVQGHFLGSPNILLPGGLPSHFEHNLSSLHKRLERDKNKEDKNTRDRKKSEKTKKEEPQQDT